MPMFHHEIRTFKLLTQIIPPGNNMLFSCNKLTYGTTISEDKQLLIKGPLLKQHHYIVPGRKREGGARTQSPQVEKKLSQPAGY